MKQKHYTLLNVITLEWAITDNINRIITISDKHKGSLKKYVFKWGGGGGVLQNDTECHSGGRGVMEFNTR